MNKKLKNLIIASLFAVGLVLFLAPQVRAVNLKDAFQGQLNTVGSRSGFNTTQRNVDPIIGTLISVTLSFLGVIFLILMVYGGYMWMTAAGNEEKAKKARQLIQAAIIGLIIVVGAYAITVFVMARISKDLITGSASGGSDVTSGGSYDGSGKSDSAGSGALGCCVNYPEVQVPMSGAPDCTDMPDDTNCGPPLLNFTFYGGVSCADVPACNGDITGGCCVNNVTVIPGPLTYECSYVTSIDLCGPPLADPVFHPGSLCTPAIGCP